MFNANCKTKKNPKTTTITNTIAIADLKYSFFLILVIILNYSPSCIVASIGRVLPNKQHSIFD